MIIIIIIINGITDYLQEILKLENWKCAALICNCVR